MVTVTPPVGADGATWGNAATLKPNWLQPLCAPFVSWTMKLMAYWPPYWRPAAVETLPVMVAPLAALSATHPLS